MTADDTTTGRKDLVQIIRDNPGCRAVIDNDGWRLYKPLPSDFDDWTDEAQGEWWWPEGGENPNLLAKSGDVLPLGDGGYGSGNTYGGDILQALAVIVGVKIESV